MPRYRFGLGLAMLALPLSLAEAQLVEVGPRNIVGFNAILARPVGEFQRFVDWGGGLNVYGVVHFSRGSKVGLRLDGSFLIYGHERFTVPLSSTVQRVFVDVSTDNMIFNFGAGPQFTLLTGAVEPYVYGTLGFSYFATISDVGGTASHTFASSTNFDDFSPALTAGGGMRIPLSYGRTPVSLDFSAQSTYHGEVQYLRRGGVVDNPDGTVSVFPIRSDANLVTFRFGIAIGV